MNKLLCLFLAVALLAGCHHNEKPASTPPAELPPVNGTAQELINRFGPVLNGVWVKADYIEKIKATKSPLAANDMANGITTMVIHMDSLKSDKLIAAAGYGNHEGGDATIIFKPGKASSTILLNGDDLSYKVENGDTVLYLEQTLSQNQKKVMVKYIKSPIKHSEYLGTGIDFMVNKALVAGDYTAINKPGQIIKFTEDGQLSGLENFKTYRINIDLNSDIMDNLDEIELIVDKHRPTTHYAYKIKADTLKLYEMHANEDSSAMIMDKVKYTLVRKK